MTQNADESQQPHTAGREGGRERHPPTLTGATQAYADKILSRKTQFHLTKLKWQLKRKKM